jgi:flagellar export protein FliJ
MKPFRFRAEAALELRRKQEDLARVAHAAATTALHAAEVRVVEARQALDLATETSAASERDGIDAWLLTWHRSWIERLRHEASARRDEAAVSAAAFERAVASMRKAHQRRRTLERLRERSEQRYQAEVRRSELKEMNLLAGLRFVAKAADQGGNE